MSRPYVARFQSECERSLLMASEPGVVECDTEAAVARPTRGGWLPKQHKDVLATQCVSRCMLHIESYLM